MLFLQTVDLISEQIGCIRLQDGIMPMRILQYFLFESFDSALDSGIFFLIIGLALFDFVFFDFSGHVFHLRSHIDDFSLHVQRI